MARTLFPPADHAIAPALSQHFFRDPALARRLVGALPLPRGACVFEVGPGRGAITDALADRGFRVIAVEKDPRLFRALRERYIGRTNVETHLGDALDAPLPPPPYAVVANVPFSITSGLIRKLLDSPAPPCAAFLVVQREAAAKFCGAPRPTLSSLLHAPWFALDVVRTFRRADFDPVPRARPVLLRIEPRTVPLLAPGEREAYGDFVRALFGTAPACGAMLSRRFTRAQSRRLAADLGFALNAPAGSLTAGQWAALFRFDASRTLTANLQCSPHKRRERDDGAGAAAARRQGGDRHGRRARPRPPDGARPR